MDDSQKMTVDAHCRCCDKTYPHTIEWSVDGETSSVRATCSSCRASGSSVIEATLYRSFVCSRPSQSALMAGMAAIQDALGHAKVEHG